VAARERKMKKVPGCFRQYFLATPLETFSNPQASSSAAEILPR